MLPQKKCLEQIKKSCKIDDKKGCESDLRFFLYNKGFYSFFSKIVNSEQLSVYQYWDTVCQMYSKCSEPNYDNFSGNKTKLSKDTLAMFLQSSNVIVLWICCFGLHSLEINRIDILKHVQFNQIFVDFVISSHFQRITSIILLPNPPLPQII